jgi:hypothetical protein
MLSSRLSDFIPEGRISGEIAQSFLAGFSMVSEVQGMDKTKAQIERLIEPGKSIKLTEGELQKIEELHDRCFGTNYSKPCVPEKVTNGAENYGDWEVMEIMEKYGDSAGVVMVLKHLLRKPKKENPNLSLEEVRLKDLKKAQNYLTRDINLRAGIHQRKIQ